MRWTYLITRLLVVALVWGFVTYGLDPLIRYSSVQALQTATGAKADVGDLKTSFFPPSVTVSNLALASARRPGWNLLQFDEMQLKLESASLSRRRFVVEEGHLNGLQFDTRRNDDGQLEKSPEPVNEEPSWMSEKLTELGTEWLTNLTEQVKSQLDPNVLETYRTGTEVYEKWDERFVEMSARAKSLKPKVDRLQAQFKKAKEGDTLQQIEQYLQVSQKAEEIIIEVQDFRDELKGIVPEVRSDFQLLNEARERDQEKVKHTLALLKPDPRRISQALLGKPMYAQLQQVLTWIEAAREYQKELHDQVQPPRSAGRDFEFLNRNPGPDFLLKKLSLSGTISVNRESVPFKAMMTDITEDPKLLGRPCVMRLMAEGSRPLQLRITYDATGDIPKSEMLADYRDTNPLPLLAGKPKEACVHATLSDLAWTTRLTLIKDTIDGSIDLKSEVGNLKFDASDKVRSEIVEAANDAFSEIRILNASVKLSGTLRNPSIDLQSDVGEQVALGVQQAFTHQLDNAKERLISEVNTYAGDQIEKLTGRFKGEYDKLMSDNKDLIEQISEVRTIVASLQSGKMDPATLLKQVSNSKLIPAKEQQKINKVMEEIDNTLQGRSLPAGLQKKIPQIPQEILQLPGSLQQSATGFIPQSGELLNSPGFLPQASPFFQQTEGLFQHVLTPPPEGSELQTEGSAKSVTSKTQTRPAVPSLPTGIRSLFPKPKK